MPHTDPIADYLTRIRNASLAKNGDCVVSYSKLKEELSKILTTEGYLKGYEVVGEGAKKSLLIRLKFYGGLKRLPVLKNIRRVSRPGCRVYYNSKRIPRVQNGLGLSILTTSKGIISDKKAREDNIGGECICSVW